MWKDKVGLLTDRLIPGVSNAMNNKMIENEMMANLPLQMALYFNVSLLPIWCIINCVLLYDNYFSYNSFTKFVIITTLTSIIIIEVTRLYLGYEGNLQNKIPEFAGFWMLSVLLQSPLQLFFLINPSFNLVPIHVVVQSIMCILLLVQIICGYNGLKYTTKQQTLYHRIKKLNNISS